MTMQPLIATDERLRRMIFFARNTKCGNHPSGGNWIADVLDALAAYSDTESLAMADELLDAATALHMQAEDADNITDPTDDRYGEWKEARAMEVFQ